MKTEPKTIRVDSNILSQLQSEFETNSFSNLVNLALSQYVNSWVWIPNVSIHEYANLSPQEFMKRVENVKYLRCRTNSIHFTFFPRTEEDWNSNRRVFDYVNGNFNKAHSNYVYFNIKFPVALVFFLKANSWDEVEKAIYGSLALLYWNKYEHERADMEVEIEPKTMRKVASILKSQEFAELNKLHSKTLDDSRHLAQFDNEYFNLILELGLDPSVLPLMQSIVKRINFPFRLEDHIHFQADMEVKLEAAYMRNLYGEDDDWQSIIFKGDTKEELKKVESLQEPLEDWKSSYEMFNHFSIEE